MGEVIVVYRVLPDGVEVNLEELENKIKETIEPQRVEKVPVAFGLSALHVYKLVPDEEGAADKIEQKLKSLEGVSEVEVIEVSRSL